MYKIAILPGDGIGPEIIAQAEKVLAIAQSDFGLNIETEHALIGGAAYDSQNSPLPSETLAVARHADAVLLGAVGGPKYDALPKEKRPETGLLQIREALQLFANLRPAIVYSSLASASSLKQELIEDLDLLIVRELTGDVYFGKPRGIHVNDDGEKEGYNTMCYSESEVSRIIQIAIELAAKRRGKLCSVDKANVLETSMLWREVATKIARSYPQIQLQHMYVDNAAMQMVKQPKQFDVIVTANLFGDILSDIAAMLTGSIGLLPSASLNQTSKGLYEPIHGSAPDIAGKNSANPIGTILSVAMMLRYTFNEENIASKIEQAVKHVLQQGVRTADIQSPGAKTVGTTQMGDEIVRALKDLS